MAYGNEEFESILNELSKGKTIKEIAKQHYMGEKTVRNLLKNNGYEYNKRQNLWYNKNTYQKEAIRIMDNVDIEAEIDELSQIRYYDRYVDNYPSEEIQETEQVLIHKGLYDEIEEISEEYGCDFTEELIELILLRFLDCNRKKDLTPIFRKQYFLEHGFNEKEVEIIMKYDDENNTPSGAEDCWWEDDTELESQDLKEFYKKELNKNNIDISDMNKVMEENNYNEFNYLKSKYDDMTGNQYFYELGKKAEKEFWEREKKYLKQNQIS